MSIFNFLQSALTPPGTNARRTVEDRQKEASAVNMDLLRQIAPLLQRQAGFSAEMQPFVESLVKQLASMNTQRNVQGRADRMRQGATVNASRQGRVAGSMFGKNSSLAKGAQVQALNAGNVAANEYVAQQNDPQQMAQNASMIAGLIQQLSQPNMGLLGGLTGGVYGQPMPHVGAGPAEIIGQLAGMYTGGKKSSIK